MLARASRGEELIQTLCFLLEWVAMSVKTMEEIHAVIVVCHGISKHATGFPAKMSSRVSWKYLTPELPSAKAQWNSGAAGQWEPVICNRLRTALLALGFGLLSSFQVRFINLGLASYSESIFCRAVCILQPAPCPLALHILNKDMQCFKYSKTGSEGAACNKCRWPGTYSL